jgi:hypothetical protein
MAIEAPAMFVRDRSEPMRMKRHVTLIGVSSHAVSLVISLLYSMTGSMAYEEAASAQLT